MRCLTLTLLITFVFAWSAPADAQLFRSKPKTTAPPPAAQRIGELIVQAKSDPDERKRAAAAEELREFDAKAHPEIVSILADVARTDAKPGVRQEALESLAKIRPVSIVAGQALERAAAQDDSWRVRWQAKTALLRYQLAGYHPPKNEPNGNNAPRPPMTQEPPLLDVARPQAKPSALGRTQPARPTPRQAKVPPNGPKAPVQPPPPAIVTQPHKAAPPAPRVSVTPTPPPIIVDVPQPPQVAAPNQVPALPVVDSAPKVSLPPAPPIVAPNAEVIEPNFRPAGQSPPRVPPPAKKKTEESGPALTVPM